MRNAFARVYRNFEEFEREELRRLDSNGSIDEMLDEMFAEELDFDAPRGGKKRPSDED
jgi:hypothetical protein